MIGSEYVAVPSTGGKLLVAKDGTAMSHRGRVLKARKQSGGYLWYCYINEEGKHRNMYAHRGVAEVFIPNPEGLRYVNHINGNKHDNRVENLEWCTARHNTRHAISEGLIWNLPKKGQQGFVSSKPQS